MTCSRQPPAANFSGLHRAPDCHVGRPLVAAHAPITCCRHRLSARLEKGYLAIIDLVSGEIRRAHPVTALQIARLTLA